MYVCTLSAPHHDDVGGKCCCCGAADDSGEGFSYGSGLSGSRGGGRLGPLEQEIQAMASNLGCFSDDSDNDDDDDDDDDDSDEEGSGGGDHSSEEGLGEKERENARWLLHRVGARRSLYSRFFRTTDFQEKQARPLSLPSLEL